MNNDKPLPQLTLDERQVLQELAESYAQQYEPRFRNCAQQAYMEGILDALAALHRSES